MPSGLLTASRRSRRCVSGSHITANNRTILDRDYSIGCRILTRPFFWSETEYAGGVIDPTPFRAKVLLTDGGVYDNHGIEPIIKRFMTILVSDGGPPSHELPTSRPTQYGSYSTYST